MIQELAYIGFEVAKPARWQDFARTVIGAEVLPGPADTTWVRIDDAPTRLILIPGTRNDLAFLGWKLADAAGVAAFAQHLESHGLTPQWGSEAECQIRHAECFVHFQDPEGNRHEAFAPLPAALPAFTSPLVASGFVTGKGGAGHVVLEADNYPATIDFCQRVLGMRLTDNLNLKPVPEVEVEVAFFHTNERHHSLAVAPRSPAPGPRKQIHHFMLEVADVRDVGRARDRCLEFGLPVVMDIGQHDNDQMISFYAYSPSGFLMEIGWGGVKVDQNTWQVQAYDRVSAWGHRPWGAMPHEALAVPAPAVEEA